MRLNVEDAPAAMRKRPMKEPAGEPRLAAAGEDAPDGRVG